MIKKRNYIDTGENSNNFQSGVFSKKNNSLIIYFLQRDYGSY